MATPRTLWAVVTVLLIPISSALSLSSYSGFHGTSLVGGTGGHSRWVGGDQCRRDDPYHHSYGAASWTMRKQKASDRRTRRLQRGSDEIVQERIIENLKNTMTNSPMQSVGVWNKKTGTVPSQIKEKTGGRGRSRKRATLYNSLSTYHNKFFTLLTDEYRAEVCLSIPPFAFIPYRCCKLIEPKSTTKKSFQTL